jgi:hemerythrin-like domain-containing protein
MARAIDILRKEHLNMSRLLALLEHQLNLFERAGPADLELIRSIAEYFGTFPRTCHHPKENVIYRKMRDKHPDELREMTDLEAEHGHVDTRVHDFLDTVDSVLLEVEMPREHFLHKARRFVDDERKHMVMEERYFFPLALDILDEEDWSEVDNEIYGAADPLFDAIVEERFQKLRRELIAWGEEVG